MVIEYAKCPECQGVYQIVDVTIDRAVFVYHYPDGEQCPGSGYLVEDEDRVRGRWPRA